MSKKTNKDYMTKEPMTVAKGSPVSKVLEMMEEHLFRHVPVTDSAKKIIGIVSDRDLISVGDFEKLKVEDIMTSQITSVQEDAAIQKTVELMLDKKISSVLVHNSKQNTVGIITTDDILKAFTKML